MKSPAVASLEPLDVSFWIIFVQATLSKNNPVVIVPISHPEDVLLRDSSWISTVPPGEKPPDPKCENLLIREDQA